MKQIGFFSWAVLAFFSLGACVAAPALPGAENQRIRVVATTNIVGDVVRQVGGEQIDLVVLMKTGVDPHSFTALPSDIAAIHDAQVLFFNGLDLEADLENIIENAGGSAVVAPLSDGLENLLPAGKDHEEEHQVDEESHQHGAYDPHVWFSVPNVITWSGKIEQTLSALDPQNAAVYQKNAQAYIKELETLDSWIFEQTTQIPEENRHLVTNHPAFGYFAARYGFAQVGAVYPLNPAAEPSAQDIAALLDLIASYSVPAIFTESSVNPHLAEQVAADSGAKLVSLYTGSLGEDGSGAESYINLMRYNTQAIVEALATAR